MPSQLPEHAVVSLLRQCFATPRCQAPQLRRQTLSRSFTRPDHRVRSARDTPLAETSCVQHQQRYYYTQHRGSDENGASCYSNSFELNSARRQDFQPQVLATQQKRGYSQGSRPQATKRIAVLGGGITGLTSAHYLAKELPNAKITIYESGDRLGGWLQSKYVDIGNGKILFEQGPRTLRPSTPSAMVTIEMVC
jgi:protoporphyrinogen/coproporphyrinogen III oxidase